MPALSLALPTFARQECAALTETGSTHSRNRFDFRVTGAVPSALAGFGDDRLDAAGEAPAKFRPRLSGQ
jgi:hypothetical protein